MKIWMIMVVWMTIMDEIWMKKGSRLYTHCSRLKVHMVACV
jgi:hypothetical protein